MAIEIIKHPSPLITKYIYKASCGLCKTIFSFKINDFASQGICDEGDLGKVNCPGCRYDLDVIIPYVEKERRVAHIVD